MARQNRDDQRVGPSGVSGITGIANIRSALQNRLLTPRGLVPFFPEYGSRLKQFQNLPMTRENIVAISNEVQSSLLRDPRVQSVEEVRADGSPDGMVKIQVFLNLVDRSRINFEVEVE